jgi:hypothetical protein
MSAIRAERDYVVHEDFMKVHRLAHSLNLAMSMLVLRN